MTNTDDAATGTKTATAASNAAEVRVSVPSLSIDDVTMTEGDASSSDATFTVTLSAASGLPVSVDWATVDGTAEAPGDYATACGSLGSPRPTSKTIAGVINGNTTTAARTLRRERLGRQRHRRPASTITNDDAASASVLVLVEAQKRRWRP